MVEDNRERVGKGQPEWAKFAAAEAELTETKREDFLEDISEVQQGISAEKEKFIRGLRTGSPKMPYPNKKKE